MPRTAGPNRQQPPPNQVLTGWDPVRRRIFWLTRIGVEARPRGEHVGFIPPPAVAVGSRNHWNSSRTIRANITKDQFRSQHRNAWLLNQRFLQLGTKTRVSHCL